MSDEKAMVPASLPKDQNARKVPVKKDWESPVVTSGKLRFLGESVLPQIGNALPTYLKNAQNRFLACLMTEASRAPSLLECTGVSIIGAMMQVAQIGLELGGPAGQAYIVAYKRKLTLVVGYKGYLTLAHRTGKVGRVTPREVYPLDKFEIEYGANQRLLHVPQMPDPGDPDSWRTMPQHTDPIGFYALCQMANGGVDFDFKTYGQALVWKQRYAANKSDYGPWGTSFNEMAKKTCIRSIAKRLPLSVEFVQAATVDECGDMNVDQGLDALGDATWKGEEDKLDATDRLYGQLEAARGEFVD